VDILKLLKSQYHEPVTASSYKRPWFDTMYNFTILSHSQTRISITNHIKVSFVRFVNDSRADNMKQNQVAEISFKLKTRFRKYWVTW